MSSQPAGPDILRWCLPPRPGSMSECWSCQLHCMHAVMGWEKDSHGGLGSKYDINPSVSEILTLSLGSGRTAHGILCLQLLIHRKLKNNFGFIFFFCQECGWEVSRQPEAKALYPCHIFGTWGAFSANYNSQNKREKKGADLFLMGLSHEQCLVKTLVDKFCRLQS